MASRTRAAHESVLAPGRRILLVGLVATITLVGFESLALSTALPAISRDLDGLALYGWVFSAYLLGTLLGSVIAGQSADRFGPARPFAIGMSIFTLGLLSCGAAPNMALLVTARFFQGLGGGAIPAMAYVVAGRGFPPDLRPRVFAIMSSAWVVPSLAGPVVAAAITDTFGWRWTFWALIPIAIPVGIATVPALRSLTREAVPQDSSDTRDNAASAREGAPQTPRIDRRPAAALCAAGVALVFLGTGGIAFPLAVGCIGIGIVMGARGYVRLVPAGTTRLRRGLPATIALRAFQTFSLFGLDAFVSHLVHDVQGYSLRTGGFAITGASLTWTAGAWIQERQHNRFSPRTFVGAGLGIVGMSGLGLIASSLNGAPIATVFVAFSIAGLGMGLGYSAVSVAMLALAAPGREGEASAALAVTDVLFTAIATGIGGALIHFADTQGWSLGTGVMLAFALPSVAGLAGCIAAKQLIATNPPAPITPTSLSRSS